MEFVFDSYCGVFCGACPIMLATNAGKLEQDKQCFGCKSEKPTGYCKTCGIKACANKQGIDFCIQCTQMTNCDLFQKFTSDPVYQYGQCVIKNMEKIQIIGLQNWLEMQAKRWRCKNCGETQSWYQESCPRCGQFVENYKADL
ncbi:MAG: hypothetical protein CVU42_16405 [Chloroflexi bacterium HGW-Chloroflexi-4]|jgi:hypothetical protein|nr:MAG: hypothetical protein CVU42_16405 [Chloroflexi bacterium HGW-Chloroflexi-4]